MSSEEIRKKFIEFFVERGHTAIPSSSLVPENDITTLFTGSGMQPLLPYLLGKPHESGNRLANSQKCFRAEDINEIGDNRHTTFFEMLGNWSLGDYFKEEQLKWFFEFLTDIVKLNPEKLYTTVFSGDEKNGIPRDDESVEIWKKLFKEKRMEAEDVELLTVERGGELGMQKGRIFYYDSKKNWWSRVGSPDKMPAREPGGPDSEIFYDFYPELGDKCAAPGFGKFCHPNCDCGRFMEIGNSVFMEYVKREDGKFEKLAQRNVDFGGGLERITAASNNDADIFLIDLFSGARNVIEAETGKKYIENPRAFRIILDHIRAAVFLIADGATPSNTDRGYVLRRLIRRAVRYSKELGIDGKLNEVVKAVINEYGDLYDFGKKSKEIISEIEREKERFEKALVEGLKMVEKLFKQKTPILNSKFVLLMGLKNKEDLLRASYKNSKIGKKFDIPEASLSENEIGEATISGNEAFDIYQSFGLPKEMIIELAREKKLLVDLEDYANRFAKHQELSRAGAEKKFGGHGLILDGELKASTPEEVKKVTRLHTATHMLQQALREVLGPEVKQMGSDITAERTRFDFAFSRKLTPEEVRAAEDKVNAKIKENLPMQKIVLPKAEAEKTGALFFFKEKYPDPVNVYFVGNNLETAWSKEFCGGPHVEHTGEIGKFKIIKEEATGSGVRRIRGIVEP